MNENTYRCLTCGATFDDEEVKEVHQENGHSVSYEFV